MQMHYNMDARMGNTQSRRIRCFKSMAGVVRLLLGLLLCMTVSGMDWKEKNGSPCSPGALPCTLETKEEDWHHLMGFIQRLTTELLQNKNYFSTSENMLVSPFGIVSAILMMALGAEDATLKKIKKALNFNVADPSLHAFLAEVRLGLKSGEYEHAVKAMANGIFVFGGYSLKKTYEDSVVGVFQPRIEFLEFGLSRCLRSEMNLLLGNFDFWKSKGKDWLHDSYHDDGIMLHNVLVFKEYWPWQSRSRLLHIDQFFISSNQSAMVTMMYTGYVKVKLGFFKDLRASAIAVPYKAGPHMIVIVLPNTVDGLDELEKHWVNSNYTPKKLLDKMMTYMADVWLPKFKINHEIDVGELMDEMNIVDLHTPKKNLRGISDTFTGEKPVHVFQSSAFQVNPENPKAPFKLGGFFGPIADVLTIFPFKIDHPFLFFVIDGESNALPLLMGHIIDPRD